MRESQSGLLASGSEAVAQEDAVDRIIQGVAGSVRIEGNGCNAFAEASCDARSQPEERCEAGFVDAIVFGAKLEVVMSLDPAGVILGLPVLLVGILRSISIRTDDESTQARDIDLYGQDWRSGQCIGVHNTVDELQETEAYAVHPRSGAVVPAAPHASWRCWSCRRQRVRRRRNR